VKAYFRLLRCHFFGGLIIGGAACQTASDDHSVGRNSSRLMEREHPAVFLYPKAAAPDSVPFVRAPRAGVFLANGMLVLENQDALLLIDSTGMLVRRVGRRGSGPGEFTDVSTVFTTDTGFGVSTLSQAKISLFSESGDFQRDIRLDNGSMAATTQWMNGVGPVVGAPEDNQEGARFVIMDQLGRQIRRIDGPPPQSLITVPVQLPSNRTSSVSLNNLGGCSRATVWGTVNGTLYYAEQLQGQLAAIDSAGERRVVYRTTLRGSMTAEVREYVSTSLSMLAVTAENIGRVLDDLGEKGATLPFAWSEIVSDPTGSLWLRLAYCDGNDGRSFRWEMVDTNGVFRRTLQTKLSIVAARGSRVAATELDSLSVPHVIVFDVSRAR
jgi:hypothetical protein